MYYEFGPGTTTTTAPGGPCPSDWLSAYATPEEQDFINDLLIGLYEDGLWNLVDPPPAAPPLNQDTMDNLVWPELQANGQEFMDCIADNYVMGDPPPCPGFGWLSEYVDQATNDEYNEVLIGMYESGEWDMTGPPDLWGPLGFDEATVNEIIWPALDDALDDGDGALFMDCVAENYEYGGTATTAATTTTTPATTTTTPATTTTTTTTTPATTTTTPATTTTATGCTSSWLTAYVDQATNDYYNQVLIELYQTGLWDLVSPPHPEDVGISAGDMEIFWGELMANGQDFVACVGNTYESGATTTAATTTQGTTTARTTRPPIGDEPPRLRRARRRRFKAFKSCTKCVEPAVRSAPAGSQDGYGGTGDGMSGWGSRTTTSTTTAAPVRRRYTRRRGGRSGRRRQGSGRSGGGGGGSTPPPGTTTTTTTSTTPRPDVGYMDDGGSEMNGWN